MSKIASFKAEFGLGAVPGLERTDGVRADWDALPAAVADAVQGLRLQDSASHMAGAVGERDFIWRRSGKCLFLRVDITAGPGEARDRLATAVTATSRMTIGYERGPDDLGEFAVHHYLGDDQSLRWVFRNIFVGLKNERCGTPIEPLARAVQRFLESNLTPSLASHVPRAEIAVSPSPIHVGDEVSIRVTLAPGFEVDDLTTAFRPGPGQVLQKLDGGPLWRTFLAESAGQTQVEVALVDKKTRLTTPLSVPIEVLP